MAYQWRHLSRPVATCPLLVPCYYLWRKILNGNGAGDEKAVIGGDGYAWHLLMYQQLTSSVSAAVSLARQHAK